MFACSFRRIVSSSRARQKVLSPSQLFRNGTVCRRISPNFEAVRPTVRAVSTTYKFNVSQQDLGLIEETLPAVGKAGTDFTKYFYTRMFEANPELLNVFNQTNQKLGGQPKKLIKTLAVAAQAAVETGELPAVAIEGICHKHAALLVTPEAYDIVGENILGTIEDLLTDDPSVLAAWGALYGEITKAFIQREKEITDEAADVPGGWRGRRKFRLTKKEPQSDIITRFQFAPVDGEAVPVVHPGKYTTIWVPVEASGPYDDYNEQPRHYTLAVPRDPEDVGKTLSISVKRQGLVSSILHDSEEGAMFDLSTPFGCFDMSGAEQLWLMEENAPVIFISAGVGITPVLAMLENIYVTRPATWLHGAKNGAVHAYRNRLREIAATRSGELQRRVWYSRPSEEDGPPGDLEESPALFNIAHYHYRGQMNLPMAINEGEKFFPPEILHLDNKLSQYYMCGPPGFMDTQKQGLMSLGVDEDRIHYEGF